MLIEQTLFALPEILAGDGYPKQEYEGGIVTALSHAILQELNGRNVLNPLSHLSSEWLYDVNGFVGPNGRKRYLRADFHLRLDRLRAGTPMLAAYGWRHRNWVEAKFFRKPRTGKTPTTANAGNLLADLVRLVALVPIEVDENDDNVEPVPNADGVVIRPGLVSGRYLLHVYQGDPETFLAIDRNATKTGNAGTRTWIRKLLRPGDQVVDNFQLDEEGDAFMGPISRFFDDIDLSVNVFNYIVKPFRGTAELQNGYWCVLSRIEAFKVSIGDLTWELRVDREGQESEEGAYEGIRDHVGSHLHPSPKDAFHPDDLEIAARIADD